MPDRDVEVVRSRSKFVATLRRVADAIERGEPVRIQVAAARFVVPANATLSIEHEVSGGEEELELQMRWGGAPPPTASGPRKRKSAKPAKRKPARSRRAVR